MKGTFLFLGSGSSAGIPLIGCHCAVCSSTLSRNKRLRPSGLVKIGEKSFLIDSGPDFRQQALLHRIEHLDGLLLTHTHFDHIAGLDELRVFNFRMKRPMPCLLSNESLEDLKKRYNYLFEKTEKNVSMIAQFQFQLVPEDFGTAVFEGMEIGAMTYFQGKMQVTGFRFGDFAYVSDIRDYDESIFDALKGVRVLILSALRSETTAVHLSVDEAVAFVRKTGAEKAWFTHISHHLEHEATERLLPPDIRMGYDGLEIEFTY